MDEIVVEVKQMENLPQRKRVRLKEYDYSQNGAYFVTICAHNRKMIFGEIANGIMQLNQNGLTVQMNIEKMHCQYYGITVDKYVIMPNHIHMIITICMERIACATNGNCIQNNNLTKACLPKTIQIFKSSVTKEIRSRDERNTHDALYMVWQSHFHDHIIRNEREYQKIWQYIDTNPLRWEDDCFYKNETPGRNTYPNCSPVPIPRM